MNIKQDDEGVVIKPPGRYQFVFRKPTVVFIEYFLPCGKTKERTRHKLEKMVVLLTDDGMMGILTDKGEKTFCWGAPGVLVESEFVPEEVEVAEA